MSPADVAEADWEGMRIAMVLLGQGIDHLPVCALSRAAEALHSAELETLCCFEIVAKPEVCSQSIIRSWLPTSEERDRLADLGQLCALGDVLIPVHIVGDPDRKLRPDFGTGSGSGGGPVGPA